MARASQSGARMSMRSMNRGSRVLSIRQTRMSIRFNARQTLSMGLKDQMLQEASELPEELEADEEISYNDIDHETIIA